MPIDPNMFYRQLGGGGGHEESEFGVHITYDQLYNAMLYLAFICVLGFFGQTYLKMPALVGQIFAGIIMGPMLLDLVPFPEAFVLFGEIGLIFLVVEAGVDIDVTTLKLIGPRGVLIATLGSIFPIAIGLGIAFALGADWKAAIASGAAFGPTSLGIAMNILRAGKIINTPTGQLIVAAAIIDDMIALIILSQLGGLVGEITIAGVLIPIVSALAFLIIGGWVALFILPDFLGKYILKESMSSHKHGRMALVIMIALVYLLMPATHYAKASHLMGAFIAGVVFCTDHDLHHTFVSQFKRILQWLMRIFFASTIGFQVPVKHFASGTVVWQGLVFTLALVGKLAVGFLVPNFSQSKKFRGNHLRDCLLVGCSMAAEGEFAFVIAAYSVDNGLIDKDLYSSIVLAILLSTIIAPFSLRFTISYFHKRSIKEIEQVEKEETEKMKTGDLEEQLKRDILDGTTVFYCIDTTSHSAWGTLPTLMKALFELKLEIIDHRSWHARNEDTVVNEVYARDKPDGKSLEERMLQIRDHISDAINQEDSVVTVTQWLPGVVDDVVTATDEESQVDETRNASNRRKSITEQLAQEARTKLDKSQKKSQSPIHAPIFSRRVRIKAVSTPHGGEDMFTTAPVRAARRHIKTQSTPSSGDMWKDNTTATVLAPGEYIVDVTGPNNEKYKARVTNATLAKLSFTKKDDPVFLEVDSRKDGSAQSQYLDGLIRRGGRQKSLSNLSWTPIPEDDH